MDGKMKKLFSALMIVMLVMIPISNAQAEMYFASRVSNLNENHEMLPNGQLVFDDNFTSSENDFNRTSSVILSKTFVGNLTYKSTGIDHTYAYLHGDSAYFDKGSKGYYEMTKRVEASVDTACSFSSEVSAEAEIIKSQITSSLEVTKTIVMEKGETWHVDFTEPGFYDIKWYARGHKYDIYGDVKWICTDSSDGTIHHEYVGEMTMPTDEVFVAVTRKRA